MQSGEGGGQGVSGQDSPRFRADCYQRHIVGPWRGGTNKCSTSPYLYISEIALTCCDLCYVLKVYQIGGLFHIIYMSTLAVYLDTTLYSDHKILKLK